MSWISVHYTVDSLSNIRQCQTLVIALVSTIKKSKKFIDQKIFENWKFEIETIFGWIEKRTNKQNMQFFTCYLLFVTCCRSLTCHFLLQNISCCKNHWLLIEKIACYSLQSSVATLCKNHSYKFLDHVKWDTESWLFCALWHLHY